MKMERKHNCQCDVCGTTMYRRPSQITGGGVYCSLICVGKKQQKPKVCKICNQTYIGSKQTCSRACANKNRTGIKYKQGSRRPLKDKVTTNRILKKRLMQERGNHCERCQYAIHQILQIHHRDRNQDNNELTNLELLCPNCHASEHYLKI